MDTELPIALPVGFTFDDELIAIEEQEKQLAEKKKQVLLKKQLGSPEFQKQLCLDVKGKLHKDIGDNADDIAIYNERIRNLQAEIVEYEGKIDKLENENEKLVERIEEIDGIDWDDTELDIEGFISENLMDEANEYIERQNIAKTIEKQVKKPVAKAPKKKAVEQDVSSISSNDSRKRKPVKYDRDTHFANLPIGLEITLSYKAMRVSTFIKVEDGVQAEDGRIFGNLSQAGREFYNSVGLVGKHFNAWDDFKVNYNGKKVALKVYVSDYLNL